MRDINKLRKQVLSETKQHKIIEAGTRRRGRGAANRFIELVESLLSVARTSGARERDAFSNAYYTVADDVSNAAEELYNYADENHDEVWNLAEDLVETLEQMESSPFEEPADDGVSITFGELLDRADRQLAELKSLVSLR